MDADEKMTPEQELQAAATERNLAAVREAFAGITDAETTDIARLLMQVADGRAATRFRRAGGAARTAEFSLLRHSAGAEAFFVSRIV